VIDRVWGVALMVASVQVAYFGRAWWLLPPTVLVFAWGLWMAWLEPRKRAAQLGERGRRHER